MTLDSSILSRSMFLDRLRLERRRSDRSKSPLSVVLFQFNGKMEDRSERVARFLAPLRRKTRETDIVGWVDQDVIGLLLPDTNERGREACVGKLDNGIGKLPYSVVSGTYPDDLFERLLRKEEARPDLSPIYVEERPSKLARIQYGLKRLLDMTGAFVALLFFSPLMLITVLAIKWTSPGPVVFKQFRMGQNGTRFKFYKFRSMYWNSDDRIHREYVSRLIEGKLTEVNQGDREKPLYKIKSDPRVTGVGRIIRKLSIDELPQLYNVLKGEMSLVGPRPPLPYEVEKYEPWHLRRVLEVKPGITGLWQVDGRSKTSYDDMVRLDIRYFRDWSLWLDVKILLKTVKAVLKPSGAM